MVRHLIICIAITLKFEESTTILNACTKTSGNLLNTLRTVALLILRSNCSTLSVPRGRVYGFLIRSKYPVLFVLLVFPTSYVGTLWVCSIFEVVPLKGISFRHPFGYVCFFDTSIHFDSFSVMDGSEFF